MAKRRWVTLQRNDWDKSIDRAVLKPEFAPDHIKIVVQKRHGRYRVEVTNYFIGEWVESKKRWKAVASAKEVGEYLARDYEALAKWFPECPLCAHQNWVRNRYMKTVIYGAKEHRERITLWDKTHTPRQYYVIVWEERDQIVKFASDSVIDCAEFARKWNQKLSYRKAIIVHASGRKVYGLK